MLLSSCRKIAQQDLRESRRNDLKEALTDTDEGGADQQQGVGAFEREGARDGGVAEPVQSPLSVPERSSMR